MSYNSFAVSCIGQRHLDSGRKCQDAVCTVSQGDFSAAAAADGHGSSMYFRSDRGARFAAEIACEKMKELFSDSQNAPDKIMIDRLISDITNEWRKRVQRDILDDPFSEDDMLFVPVRYKKAFAPFSAEQSDMYDISEKYERFCLCGENLRSVYGTTLICAGGNDEYCLCIHIGDGKCVAIYDDGTTDEPVPWDEQCCLNLTTSLCEDDAEKRFRYHLWTDRLPAAVFVGTDGMDSSLRAELHSYYKIRAIELTEMTIDEAVDVIRSSLPDITARGSGDDVSVACIADVDMLKSNREWLKKGSEFEYLNARLCAAEDRLFTLKYQYTAMRSRYDGCKMSDPMKAELYLSELSDLEELIGEAITELMSFTDQLMLIDDDE